MENGLVVTAHQPGRDAGKGLQSCTMSASMGDWGNAMGELERAGKWHHQQPRVSGMASWRK